MSTFYVYVLFFSFVDLLVLLLRRHSMVPAVTLFLPPSPPPSPPPPRSPTPAHSQWSVQFLVQVVWRWVFDRVHVVGCLLLLVHLLPLFSSYIVTVVDNKLLRQRLDCPMDLSPQTLPPHHLSIPKIFFWNISRHSRLNLTLLPMRRVLAPLVSIQHHHHSPVVPCLTH